MRQPADYRYPIALLSLFSIIWLALAWAPAYRQDWLLENLLVFLAVPWLIHQARTLRLSNTSYTLITVFLLMHAIGAHYTYSEVPIDAWSEALTGHTLSEALGFERNHYDRWVHFLYGLLITPAMTEWLDARVPQRGLWRWTLPWLFILSHSALYELLEWVAATVFGGDLGQAYLGTQGDEWDAQKDTALAALGALLAILLLRSRRPTAPA